MLVFHFNPTCATTNNLLSSMSTSTATNYHFIAFVPSLKYHRTTFSPPAHVFLPQTMSSLHPLIISSSDHPRAIKPQPLRIGQPHIHYIHGPVSPPNTLISAIFLLSLYLVLFLFLCCLHLHRSTPLFEATAAYQNRPNHHRCSPLLIHSF